MPTPKAISSNSRVFIQPWDAGPSHPLEYQGTWRSQGLTEPAGDATRVQEPDPFNYGQFNTVAVIRGEPALFTTTLEARLGYQISRMKYLKDLGCPLAIHVNLGQCTRPDVPYDADVIFILEGANITQWATTELGALDGSQNAAINETIPISYVNSLQIKKLLVNELDASGITREIISVNICDRINCGVCGSESTGCSKVFGVSVSAGGSPGLPADVIFSSNGGSTWGKTNISTLSVGSAPSDAACVGEYYVVATQTGLQIHYATQAAILAGTATWTANTAGLVASKGPNAFFAPAASQVWAAANGGYVYKWSDITGTASVQTDGSVTSQNLTAIHGSDALNIVAVGASNAVIFTQDGGGTWQAVTGPAPAVALNTVWVRDQDTWFIGTAGGKLFYTNNTGSTWTEITFPGSGAGTVNDIQFVQSASQSVGYLAHATATPVGRIFRTLDGGATWTLQPQVGSSPAYDRANSIATCWDPNIFFAAGLGDNGTDGVLIKGA